MARRTEEAPRRRRFSIWGPGGDPQGLGGWIPLVVGLILLFSVFAWMGSHRKSRNAAVRKNAAQGMGGSGHDQTLRRYQCDEGPIVSIQPVTPERAKVSFKGQTFEMHRVRTESGARFAEGPIAWDEKGEHGALSVGDSILAKDCVLLR